jgi:multisubunit Na+/H+ antiporter MnhB subunit
MEMERMNMRGLWWLVVILIAVAVAVLIAFAPGLGLAAVLIAACVIPLMRAKLTQVPFVSRREDAIVTDISSARSSREAGSKPAKGRSA